MSDRPRNMDEYLETLMATGKLNKEEMLDAIARAKMGDRAARAMLVKTYLVDTAEIALDLRPDGVEEMAALAEANGILLQLVGESPEDLDSTLRDAIEDRFSELWPNR